MFMLSIWALQNCCLDADSEVQERDNDEELISPCKCEARLHDVGGLGRS